MQGYLLTLSSRFGEEVFDDLLNDLLSFGDTVDHDLLDYLIHLLCLDLDLGCEILDLFACLKTQTVVV